MGFNRASIAILAAGALAALLAACAGGETFLEPAEPSGRHPFPERSATYGRSAHEVHGIDIAKYQGNIDWDAVKRSGIGFAFIKATEGSDRVDNKFQQNWAAAKAANIPRGAYHFNYWCSPMQDQFQWFRRNVPRDKDALPPVLDLEWNHASPTCPRKVSRAHAQREIRTFVRLAEAWYGKRPILYTDIRFYRDVLSDGSFSQYPLWVRATKRLPHEIYPGRKWVFWQYSDRSRVPGISGHVDRNAFAGSRRDWNRLVAANFMRGNVVTPAAQPGPQRSRPMTPPATAVAAAERKPEKEQKTAAKAATKIASSKPADKKTTITPVNAVRAFAPAGKPLSLTPLNLGPKTQKAIAGR